MAFALTHHRPACWAPRLHAANSATTHSILWVKLLNTCPLYWVDSFPFPSRGNSASSFKTTDVVEATSLFATPSFYRSIIVKCWHLWNILFAQSIEWRFLSYRLKYSFWQIRWWIGAITIPTMSSREGFGNIQLQNLLFSIQLKCSFIIQFQEDRIEPIRI